MAVFSVPNSCLTFPAHLCAQYPTSPSVAQTNPLVSKALEPYVFPDAQVTHTDNLNPTMSMGSWQLSLFPSDTPCHGLHTVSIRRLKVHTH